MDLVIIPLAFKVHPVKDDKPYSSGGVAKISKKGITGQSTSS